MVIWEEWYIFGHVMVDIWSQLRPSFELDMQWLIIGHTMVDKWLPIGHTMVDNFDNVMVGYWDQ